MRRFVGMLLLAAAAAACSSGSGGGGGSSSNTQGGETLMAGFDPGPAPDPSKGFQIVLPIVDDIPADGNVEYCTWTSLTLPQDVWVKGAQGFQSETGHHVVMYYSSVPVTPVTKVCANEDMAEFKYGLGASAGPGAHTTSLPGNLATHLPAGAQIVVNHHYLNASATDVPHAQSALNIYYADPGAQVVSSGTMAITDSSMTVPAGASSYNVDCTVNAEYAAWQLLPHMHAWGTHIAITHTNSGGTKQLFDLDWDASYTFDTSSIQIAPGPASPYMFEPGDKIHIQCDYMNTTGVSLVFGTEMCVFFSQFVDSKSVGDMVCDTGHWSPF